MPCGEVVFCFMMENAELVKVRVNCLSLTIRSLGKHI